MPRAMAHYRYLKLVILFLLPFLPLKSAATANATHRGIERGPDRQEPTPNGVSRAPSLRHDTTSRGNDTIERLEERALDNRFLSQVTISLRRQMVKLYHIARLGWWQHSYKTPQEWFVFLNLHEIEPSRLLQSPAFSAWITFVRLRHPRSAGNAIISTMLSHYENDELAAMLFDALTSPTRKLTLRVYNYLQFYWISKEETPDSVFELLKLDTDNLLTSPLLYTWVDFLYVRKTKAVRTAIVYKLALLPSSTTYVPKELMNIVNNYVDLYAPLVKRKVDFI
ncbi:hypothetical protein PsorP6_011867 [Peronosclerospora sorghi]|uniref:Uncharacterized protein n=1 Tax=Peronosclerospora sorghi TaxID=230839 RepID=A0ACC0WIP7_9STRA|nr:hypothetical protein PsorP6_011867 [Peronosclerospora sorghi]